MADQDSQDRAPGKSAGKSGGMKSAYEAALERLDAQGIERPREESLTDEVKARIADARSKAVARLAELEILHRDRLRGMYDPVEREKEEEEYRAERSRVEASRDREIAKIRG